MENKTPRTETESRQAMRTYPGLLISALLVVFASFSGNAQGMEPEKHESTGAVTTFVSATSTAGEIISVLGLNPGESLQSRGRVNGPVAERKDPNMGTTISPLDHHAHAAHRLYATKGSFAFVEIGEYKQSKSDYLKAAATGSSSLPGITVGIGFRF